MIIRKEQVRVLITARENDFLVRLGKLCRLYYPDAAASDDGQLHEWISGQVKTARFYSLSTEQQIAVYVWSAWLLGGNFDQSFPAINAMMGSSASADDKSEWLEYFTVEFLARLERVS